MRSSASLHVAVRIAVVAGTSLALAATAGLTSAGAAGSSHSSPRAAVHVRGTVERLHLDDFARPATAGDDELTFVRNGKGPSSGMVQVPSSALASVPTGATVDVGLASTDGITTTASGALTSDATGSATQDPEAGADVATLTVTPTAQGAVATGDGVTAADVAVAAGAAAHQVTVVLVKPPGGTTPSATVSSVVSTVAGGVSSYWSSMTGGQVSFTATGYPTLVSTTNAPCTMTNGSVSVASSGAFWNEVETKVGFTSGSGKHLVVYFAGYSACGGIAGLGTVGSGLASGGVVWINGYNTVGVIGHELGHNLGLGHSQVLDCSVGGVRVTEADPSACSPRSYADTNDIMALSWNNVGYLNASHLRYLGLLTATDEVQPTDTGTVTLAPLETPGAVRVLTLSDGATHYVFEYRRPIGQDSWLTSYPTWGSSGVSVRKEFDLTQAGTSAYQSDESYLLDGDPSTSDAFGALDAALPTGVWVELAGGNLGVRITSETTTGATIEYRNGPATVDPRYVAPPQPTVSTPVARLGAGVIRATTTGAYVPVRWTYYVTTPSTTGGTDTVTPRTITTQRKAGNGSLLTASYTGTAVATDGTVVTAVGVTAARYLGETSTTLRAGYSRRAWSTVKIAGAMGTHTKVTASRGASVWFNVTGRSIGVLLSKGTAYGKARVYVDGHYAGTVSQHATRSSVGVAWTWTFHSSGRHSVRIVNVTGGSHGKVGFDGVVALS